MSKYITAWEINSRITVLLLNKFILSLEFWSKRSLLKLQKILGFVIGETYTILNNKLNVKMFNNEFFKAEMSFENRTNLNKDLPKDRKAGIQRPGFKRLLIKY